MERAPPTPNPERSSAMGQVSGRRAARAPLPAAGRPAGSPRLRGQFSQRCRIRGRVQRIRIFFVFIDFPAAVRCRRQKRPSRRALTPGPSRFRSGNRSRAATRAPPGPRDWRRCSHGKTPRSRKRGRWRRLHLLGGACHRDAAAEYQKPAVNRSFKGSRWPVHSTHGAGAGRATQAQHCERDD